MVSGVALNNCSVKKSRSFKGSSKMSLQIWSPCESVSKGWDVGLCLLFPMRSSKRLYNAKRCTYHTPNFGIRCIYIWHGSVSALIGQLAASWHVTWPRYHARDITDASNFGVETNVYCDNIMGVAWVYSPIYPCHTHYITIVIGKNKSAIALVILKPF